MTIVVLSARPETASNRRLSEAADAAGIGFDLVDATTLSADETGVLWNGAERLSGSPDVVLARIGNWRPASLLAVLEAFTAAGATTPNPASAMRIGRDHWQTVRALSAAGLPVPPTIAGADPESLATTAAERLEFPVVVKQRRSRMGVGVIRCDALDHLQAVLDSLWRVGDEVVVQQFVNCSGESRRLLVVGSNVVAAARFSAPVGDWRSNASRGGVADALQPDRVSLELARRAAAGIGLGICGVDLLPTANGPVVCEVNPTPGFAALERATGIDVAGEIVAHLAAR
jgi:RimK family alpha-L-glutamate ligase